MYDNPLHLSPKKWIETVNTKLRTIYKTWPRFINYRYYITFTLIERLEPIENEKRIN